MMLTATLGNSSRIASSAHNFRQYFAAMKTTGGSLGPVERFVYSLVLASGPSTDNAKHTIHTDSRI